MAIRRKLAVALALTAILTSSAGVGEDKSATPAHPESSSNNACYQRLADAMEHMHEAMMAVKPSSASSADSDFVRLMLPHHEAAVEMAKVELECGSDPQMKRLAQEIVADQQSEIQLMQLWLKKHPSTAEK